MASKSNKKTTNRKKNANRKPANKKPTSKKRNTKNTKKKKKTNKQKSEGLLFISEYRNIIMIFFGGFVGYGLYTSSTALVPELIQWVFKGMFGGLSILVPLIMVIYGITGCIEGNEKIDRLRKTKMFYLLIVFFIIYYGLIHYALSPSESPLDTNEMLDMIDMGKTGEGIGLVPSFITYYLTHTLGLVGSWLITIFATMISAMYVFNISVKDIVAIFENPMKGKEGIFSKLKMFKKMNIDGEDVEGATLIGRTGFIDRLLGRNDEYYEEYYDEYEDDEYYDEYEDEYYEDDEYYEEDEEDDEDKTIKIVGFNKSEDEFLEILEGDEEGMSDLEILQMMQNAEPDISGVISEEDLLTSPIEEVQKQADTIVPKYRDNENVNISNDTVSTVSAVSPKPVLEPMNEGLNAINELKKKRMGAGGDIIHIDKETALEENEHLKYKNYKKPPINLLDKRINKSDKKDKQRVLENARHLERTLGDFGVQASINQVTVGPTITRYEIQPKPGVKVSKIVNLTDDIALSLAAKSIRMEAPIPGKSAIGIEVPNDKAQMVGIREIMESSEFKDFKSPLAMGLGKDVAGNIIIGDIGKMPHLLIAGSTGSGKSVCVNTLITSILYKTKPDEVKLMLIDPKVVELANYNGIPHLMIPVVTDAKKAANALAWAVSEMNRRYKLFAEAMVKDITSYNEKAENPLPKIVIIIDELADLMMVSANDVEDYICRLAQMARAAGMHLIVATQRPSVDVITGVIKANIPSRIAFAVSSQTDSRTIIDMGGAEKLLGKGDMLFYPLGASKPQRLQGAFISEEESDKIIEYVKKEAGEVNYMSNVEESISQINTEKSDDTDDLLMDAIEFVVNNGQASASMLQRKFKIGFNRAARLIDDMEERGIVGQSEGSKPRKVLVSREELSQL